MHFIEANAQFNSVTVYYGNLKEVNNQLQNERALQQQSGKQAFKKDVKGRDDEADPVAKQPQKSRRKKSVSIS